MYPITLKENARVNPRTQIPDHRLLTPNIDPPRFTPQRKEDIHLPESGDSAHAWVWISPWTVAKQPTSDVEGWRFAQRWDVPEREWVDNPASITPISRAGLVAQRTWTRIMNKRPIGQSRVGSLYTAEHDHPRQASSSTSAGNVSSASAGTSQRSHRSSSMGSKLVGLVAGQPSKGK